MVAHAAETEGPNQRKALESPKDLKDAADFRGSFSGYESNRFFINGGEGQPYVEAGFPCGLAAQTDGRAVASFDLEGDGRPDLAVLSLQDFRVYRNQSENLAGNFVEFELVDRFGGPALGATVTLRSQGKGVVDRIRLTAGFHTQVASRVHMGLGPAKKVDLVEVRWPTGRRQTWTHLEGNRRYRLLEARRMAQEIPMMKWSSSAIPSQTRSVTLSTISLTDFDGARVIVPSNGKPSVLNLWAPWCKPCAKEAPELALFHSKFSQDINVIGVSVEMKQPQKNKDFVAKYKLSYPNHLMTAVSAQSIFRAGDEVRLPTTLIFDAKGRMVRRFNRSVTAQDLERWTRMLTLAPAPEDYERQKVILEADGDFYAGLNVLKKAADAAENEPLRYMSLARLAITNSQGDLAITAAQKAVSLAERSEEAWAVLVDVLSRFKGRKVALEAIEKAPKTPSIMVLKANLLIQEGKGDEGLALIRRAIALRPKNTVWKKQLAEYLDKLSRGFRNHHNKKPRD